jgi:hypothetical protein
MKLPVKIALVLVGWAASLYALFTYAPLDLKEMVNLPMNIGWGLTIVAVTYFSLDRSGFFKTPIVARTESKLILEDDGGKMQREYFTLQTGEPPASKKTVEDKQPRLRRPKV